jgi:hypothetical protein
MRRLPLALVGAGAVASLAAQIPSASGQVNEEVAPLYGITLPSGYRDWRLISVAREEAGLDDLRAILGNSLAIEAARHGRTPYPDGTIIARLAWSYHPLEESSAAFGRPQSFVAGRPKNGVQFMVKDSTRFAATGGWGFAQFDDGRPASEAVHNTCYACHQVASSRDFVFNRHAP